MFYPPRASVSVEDFSSGDGFTLGDSQSVSGGKLSLQGTYVLGNPKLKWADAVWTEQSDFISYPDVQAPLDQWQFVSLSLSVVDPVFTGEYDQVEEIIGWDTVSGGGGSVYPPKPIRTATMTQAQWKRVLNRWKAQVKKIKKQIRKQRQRGIYAPPPPVWSVQTPVTEIVKVPRYEGHERVVLREEYFFQNTSDHWGINVNNPNGYTVEIRAQMKSGEQRLLIDDGTYRENFFLKPDGVWQDNQLKLAVGWESEFRSVRLAVQNQELFLLNEDGYGYYGTSDMSEPSEEQLFLIGNTSDTEGELLIDYIYQTHPGVYIDTDQDIVVNYDTSIQTAITPAFNPERVVIGFSTVTVRTDSADFSGGTIEVQVQQYSGSLGVWTDYGSPVSISQQYQVIDISGMVVDGDGSDQVRVVVVQQANSSTTKPPAVEAFVVRADYGDTDSEVAPDTSSIYERGIDRAYELGRSWGTKSVFRIKDTVPDGEIGIAYISSPNIEPDVNVGIIDLSFVDSANVVVGAEASFYSSPDTSDGSSFTYNDMDTNESLVAVGCSSWGPSIPSYPLFFGYLLGRGRYYLKSTQTSTTDVEEIRDSIYLHFEDNTPVNQDEYPWDIIVSSVDIDDRPLPAGVFSVVLLTNKKYLPNRTILVSYSSVDRSKSWALVDSKTEVVNPVELMAEDSSPLGFSTTLDETDNTFNLVLDI